MTPLAGARRCWQRVPGLEGRSRGEEGRLTSWLGSSPHPVLLGVEGSGCLSAPAADGRSSWQGLLSRARAAGPCLTLLDLLAERAGRACLHLQRAGLGLPGGSFLGWGLQSPLLGRQDVWGGSARGSGEAGTRRPAGVGHRLQLLLVGKQPPVQNLPVFYGGKILMRSPGFHVKSNITMLAI